MRLAGQRGTEIHCCSIIGELDEQSETRGTTVRVGQLSEATQTFFPAHSTHPFLSKARERKGTHRNLVVREATYKSKSSPHRWKVRTKFRGCCSQGRERKHSIEWQSHCRIGAEREREKVPAGNASLVFLSLPDSLSLSIYLSLCVFARACTSASFMISVRELTLCGGSPPPHARTHQLYESATDHQTHFPSFHGMEHVCVCACC